MSLYRCYRYRQVYDLRDKFQKFCQPVMERLGNLGEELTRDPENPEEKFRL